MFRANTCKPFPTPLIFAQYRQLDFAGVLLALPVPVMLEITGKAGGTLSSDSKCQCSQPADAASATPPSGTA